MRATRRSFLKQVGYGGAALGLASFTSVSAHAAVPNNEFALPPLPYDYAALEPVIDAETMRLHHDKHHQAYLDKLMGEMKKDKALAQLSLARIVSQVSKYNETVRNNAGGFWNHNFFWRIMRAPRKGNAPTGELKTAIEKKFGTFDDFRQSFEKAGTDRFGSGWVWLIEGDDGLEIVSTPNQDNPLMDIAEKKGMPVLGNDVWEHAYYIKYRNKRPDYLKAWWQVANWDEAARLYAQATARR
jgi:superoxide dismutase, Fe-Mn family